MVFGSICVESTGISSNTCYESTFKVEPSSTMLWEIKYILTKVFFHCSTILYSLCFISFFITYSVTARPNLPYIVWFGPYRPHDFVHGDASPHLSLTPQNMYNKLATSTLNKANYHSLTCRCGILQSTPLRSPTTL